MKTKNLAASVLARLKNVARERNVVYGEILVRYAIERTLKRIEKSPYASKCILKGGSLLMVWGNGSSFRPTMDADLEFRGEGTPESFEKMFREIAKTEGAEEDGLTLDQDSIRAVQIREDDEYGGVRIFMRAFIGNVRIPVQFDVGIGDAITPAARIAQYPALLGGPAPRIKVYPKETVIAEKFETIVKRGLANSRIKDYYDLWMLSKDDSIDLKVVAKAVGRTFKRRMTPIPQDTPDGLRDEFATSKVKIQQWNAFVRKNRILVDGMAFLTIVHVLRSYLSKVLSEHTDDFEPSKGLSRGF